MEIFFLPVGHTHEDVDRVFSWLAHALRNSHIPTYGVFMKVLSNAEKSVQRVENVEGVVDYDIFMQRHCTSFHNLRIYRHFHFAQDPEDGKIYMK